ncbi:MAG TPA: polysaccharide deacetylase family protein [Pyrinomonadaceae bacterium]|nr:polysaccharide deacetylase family protein [Pyrinomonadaceae bacterium]
MPAIALMYHDVVDGDAYDASGFAGADAALYKLGRAEFEAHLAAIAASGAARPVTVAELGGPGGAARPLLLTFDDGGVSAYTHAAPALERRGWRGHFFVTTGRVGTPGFLSREQILDLDRRGHVVGSHSATHPARMARCGYEEVLREWRSSAAFLSDILGRAVTAASVPGGYYSRRVAEAADEAGIRHLFTSEPTAGLHKVGGCLVVGRYAVQRWTTPRAAAAIAAGRLAPRLRQAVLWNAKKATKAVGGEFYLRARKALIGKG